jgi:hypothetical protein
MFLPLAHELDHQILHPWSGRFRGDAVRGHVLVLRGLWDAGYAIQLLPSSPSAQRATPVAINKVNNRLHEKMLRHDGALRRCCCVGG